MAKNKKWSSAAKFEIALLAIKNDTPLNDICKKYEVSPSQVHAWKKQLLEEGGQLFNKADNDFIRQLATKRLNRLKLKWSLSNVSDILGQDHFFNFCF